MGAHCPGVTATYPPPWSSTRCCFWLRSSLHSSGPVLTDLLALPCPHHPGAAGLAPGMSCGTGRYSGLAAATLQAWARLSRGCTCSESVSPPCCVSASQWSAGNPGWTWGWTIHYYPDGPPANKLPPAPETVCSAGLEVWLPERGLLPAGGTVTPRWGFMRPPQPRWAPRPSESPGTKQRGSLHRLGDGS